MSQSDKKAERFLRSRARPTARRDRSRANEPRSRASEARSRASEARPVYNTRAAANTGSDVEESGEEEVMITPSDSDEDDLPWNSSSRWGIRRSVTTASAYRELTVPSGYRFYS